MHYCDVESKIASDHGINFTRRSFHGIR